MGNTEYEKKPPEETTDAQGTDTSIFGAVDAYRDSYEEVLDQQDTYLKSAYQKGKDRAAQSYQQEQSAAYSDYQRQVDPYGAQAEQLAASGLSNSGYAESLKTQAYVAYQNRLAVARQSYESTLASFETAFNEAKMQNDSKRAEIAAQTAQAQWEMIVSMVLSGNVGANIGAMVDASQIMKMAKSAKGDSNAWKKMVGEYYTNKVNVTSRKDAITLLEDAGLSIKPLTEKDWEWGKGSAEDYQKYSTYAEYLNGFVAQNLYGVN